MEGRIALQGVFRLFIDDFDHVEPGTRDNASLLNMLLSGLDFNC